MARRCSFCQADIEVEAVTISVQSNKNVRVTIQWRCTDNINHDFNAQQLIEYDPGPKPKPKLAIGDG